MLRRTLALALLSLTACGPLVVGNGKRVTTTRDQPAFTRVDVSSAIELTATPGPAKVTVSTDENLQEFIETFVEGDRLVVRVRDEVNLGFPHRIFVEVSSPRLEALTASGASTARFGATACDRFELEASGASTVSVTGLDSTLVKANASGSSTVRATGTSKQLDADASGSSSMLIRELSSTNATVRADGASVLQFTATGTASGHASGASTIEIFGHPASAQIDSSGASTVRRAE